MRLGWITIDPGLEKVEIAVIKEASSQESIPQCSRSSRTSSLRMEYEGDEDDSTLSM